MKEWTCTCEAGYCGEVYHCPMHAAAPEMHKALENIVERYGMGLKLYRQDINPAREALAKAGERC